VNMLPSASTADPQDGQSTFIRVTTDENGRGQFTVSGNIPGVCVICFRPEGERGQKDRHFDSLYDFFINLRVLPRDDYSHITDAELKAPDAFSRIIYPEVLRFYYLFYPVMRNFLTLNSEQAILDPNNGFYESMALGATTDEEFRIAAEEYSYMPRTREISMGKRTLLRRWYDLNVKKKQAFAGKTQQR